jgi:hypothetical protein
MKKKQSEKLTPAASEARYPTLVELRRDSGLLKSGLAAVVLASGLTGCGSKDEVSLSGKVDGSYFAQDVQRPDLQRNDLNGAPTDAVTPDGSPDGSLGLDVFPDTRRDSSPPDQPMIIDGVPFIPYFDGGVDSARENIDSAPDQEHDQGTGDARQDSGALDGQPGEAGAGTATDSEIDLK